MKEEFTKEQLDWVAEMLDKAESAEKKTQEHSNMTLEVDGCVRSLRVDDVQLFVLACRFMPNIVNYIINIVPSLLYPYIVSYLQNLSDDERSITINELYDLVSEIINEEE